MPRVIVAVVLATVVASVVSSPETLAAGVNCSNFSSQASAQSYFDGHGGSSSNNVEGLDADHDGVACESNLCPCRSPGAVATPTPTPTVTPTATYAVPTPTPTVISLTPTDCLRPPGIQSIRFSRSSYPNVFRHFKAALRRGWPRVLVLNRDGADARRERLLSGVPTRPGKDRDEYPPAVGRGRGAGLTRGFNPRGWKGDVAYVPSSENRSHGAVLGNSLAPFCDGTKFKYRFARGLR